MAIKRVLYCCRWGLPFRPRASISSGAMRTLSVSGSRETAGRSWISIRVGGFGDIRGWRVRGVHSEGFTPQNSSWKMVIYIRKMSIIGRIC